MVCAFIWYVPESVPPIGTIRSTFGHFWTICPSKCPYHRDHLLYIWAKSAYLSLKASLLQGRSAVHSIAVIITGIECTAERPYRRDAFRDKQADLTQMYSRTSLQQGHLSGQTNYKNSSKYQMKAQTICLSAEKYHKTTQMGCLILRHPIVDKHCFPDIISIRRRSCR